LSSRMRTSSIAVLLCATLSAHGLQLRATHFAPRVTDTPALRPRSPLLTQPLATPPCRARGKSPTMRAAPPAGFEWGEVDRERWFDSLPSILRRVGKPLLLLGVFSAIASLPSARGRFWGLYRAYEAAAITRPLITKSATSGVAYLLGDTIAQRRSAAGGPLSRGRLTRATIAGAVSHGPQLHYWTVFLERSGLPLLGKIALDQTFFALYINAAFCVLTEALQRRPLRDTLAKVRAAARPCLVAGWRFWPLAHALTYSVVPLPLRVLWVDVLEIAWVAILSTAVASSQPQSPCDFSSCDLPPEAEVGALRDSVDVPTVVRA